MLPLSSRFWAFFICAVSTAVPSVSGASPDPRVAASRLEDRLVDGEIDAEDFLRWHLAPGAIVDSGRGAAYVGLEAFSVERADGASELGAMLVLELPLERFLASAAPRAPLPPVATTSGAPMDGIALPTSAFGRELRALGDVSGAPRAVSTGSGLAQSAPARMDRAPAPVLTVTAEVARSCVRAALRAVGLSDDQRLDSVASRARSSAALPELRFRAVRTLGETGRVTLSEEDPSRYVASGAASNVLEARLTFRLDRLLFADEEIAVERARLDRSEVRSRIAAKVLQALFEWQKAYAAAQDATLPAEDRWNAALREAESSAILDVMTGGWFGAYRAALASRAP